MNWRETPGRPRPQPTHPHDGYRPETPPTMYRNDPWVRIRYHLRCALRSRPTPKIFKFG